jgi:hercynylcysteine S-oxide lyase
LEFRKWLGGEHKINDYCRSLALSGGKRLAEIFGTRRMDESPSGEFTLNMVREFLLFFSRLYINTLILTVPRVQVNVELPLSPKVPDTPMNRTIMQYKLLDEAKVSAPVFTHNGVWWTRCSAQVWNEVRSPYKYTLPS